MLDLEAKRRDVGDGRRAAGATTAGWLGATRRGGGPDARQVDDDTAAVFF